MKKVYPITFILVGCLFLSVALLGNTNTNAPITSEEIQYRASVCVAKNGILIGCSSNVLYNTGKDALKTMIGDTGSGGPFKTIELCNATAGCGEPTAAKDGDVYNAYTSCGFEAAEGTYTNISIGNWSVYHEFTASCDGLLVNASRLGNAAMATDLAGNNFTLATCQTNDKLNLNWTLWITS